MPDDSSPALVVVAAGGLGTRVHGWAQFIPKEFYPVGGRPGITRLLEEIAGAGTRTSRVTPAGTGARSGQ